MNEQATTQVEHTRTKRFWAKLAVVGAAGAIVASFTIANPAQTKTGRFSGPSGSLAASFGYGYGYGSPLTDLELTITANKKRVHVHRTVVFTVTVRNNGPEIADAVDVITNLSKRLTFKSVTGAGCTTPPKGSNEVHCTVGPITPKNSVVIVVAAKARLAGISKTVAEATPLLTDDLAPSDNEDQVKVKVVGGRRR